MYYINQLDYPHIRYEHDLDNGGAPEEKCTAAAAACGPCCLCMIVENMTFGHLELTDCLELSAKLGANRQRGTIWPDLRYHQRCKKAGGASAARRDGDCQFRRRP